jgi:hypothetical protein
MKRFSIPALSLLVVLSGTFSARRGAREEHRFGARRLRRWIELVQSDPATSGERLNGIALGTRFHRFRCGRRSEARARSHSQVRLKRFFDLGRQRRSAAELRLGD